MNIGRSILLAALVAVPGLAGAQVTPAAVNQAVEKLQALARQSIQNGTVPGIAVAVVFDDKLVYAGGFGVRDVTTGSKVDADTVFQLASVSKPLASTVVAELVGEGKIAWSSKISDLDPGFQLADPWVTREVRIDDLFSHRAGLVDHAGDWLESLGFSRAEILHRLRYGKPGGAFRASYAYTNFGLTEAALAATRPYDVTWEEAAESRLFRPLGMVSTSYRYADFTARADKALGHVKVNGRWVQKFRHDPDPQAPAGGASSSVDDLAKWMRLQLSDGTFEGRRIVDAAALAETHAPQARTRPNPLTGAPQFYGLGWNVTYDPQGRLRLSHSGAFNLGAATTVSLVPAEHLGIVVLTNAAPVGAAETLAFTFIDDALYGRQTHDWAALFGKIFADPVTMGEVTGADYAKPRARPSPSAAASAYVATYTNPYFGDVEISDQGGRLAMALGPAQRRFPLTHYDRDIFTYEPVGEDANGPSGVIFTLGADGRATTMTVEHLNVNGDGVFARKLSAPAR